MRTSQEIWMTQTQVARRSTLFSKPTSRNPEMANAMTDEQHFRAALASLKAGLPQQPHSRRATEPAAAGWPEPQPLAANVAAEPYPSGALPLVIRKAVAEVAAFVQAPVALVAASALGAMSLACQGFVNIERARTLSGPTSLYLLSIATSGERKSSCDGYFSAAIRLHEKTQAEATKPAVAAFEAALSAWNAEREGLLAAIKDAKRTGKTSDHLKAELVE